FQARHAGSPCAARSAHRPDAAPDRPRGGRSGGSAPTPGCGAIRPTPSTGSCGDICGLRSRPTPHELSCLTPFERYDGGGQGLRHSLRMTEGVAAAMRPAGEAEIVDVVRQIGSPWFFGPPRVRPEERAAIAVHAMPGAARILRCGFRAPDIGCCKNVRFWHPGARQGAGAPAVAAVRLA